MVSSPSRVTVRGPLKNIDEWTSHCIVILRIDGKVGLNFEKFLARKNLWKNPCTCEALHPTAPLPLLCPLQPLLAPLAS